MQNNHNRPMIIWLFTGCLLIYMMVLIGGITRLTNSGLSMVEWNYTGSLPPLNEEEWTEEFNKYRQSPEFKLINYRFSLEDFKRIFWWEFFHRFLGRTIGIVFLIPFFYFILKRELSFDFKKKLFFLLFIGATQGLIGWFMVKSGLQKNPHVSHYRLATHLITAFTVFGFTFWYALDLIYPYRESRRDKAIWKYSIILLSVIVLQVIYGAFVAGLKAGYLYPTFPKMGDSWMPNSVYTQLNPILKNFTEGQAGVQFIHRCLGFIILALAIVLFLRIKKHSHTLLQRKIVNWMFIIISSQFLLGVATVIFNVSIAIALIHQTGAFLVFSILLYLIHRIQ